MPVTLDSPAFSHMAAIPRRYTCDGENVSPHLRWSDLPPAARSIVLIVDDPDAPDPAAPKRVWTHWVLYNLPPDTRELKAAIAAAELPTGTLEGKNDWGQTGYGGPCPPVGRHRYFFKLYILNQALPDLSHPTKATVENAIKGHIIAHAEFVGTYQKSS